MKITVQQVYRLLIRCLFLILTIYTAPLFLHFACDRLPAHHETIQRAKRTLISSNNRIKCALFSPDDEIHEILLGLIAAAEQRISIACYVLTDKRIADALVEAHQRGVRIELVVCRSGAKDASTKVDKLRKQGITVYVYPAAFSRSLMHNKFIVFHRVFGRSLVCTGSYNLTRSASQINQENMIFLDDGDLIKRYSTRFEEIKVLSHPLKKGAVVE